jgi:hypothetical protein
MPRIARYRIGNGQSRELTRRPNADRHCVGPFARSRSRLVEARIQNLEHQKFQRAF